MDFKTAKISFFFAVIFLVAKPFLGFTMFSRVHPPANENIFVKSFTKRLQEYSENSHDNIKQVQKKLADPFTGFVLLFSFLLAMLFPMAFGLVNDLTNRRLKSLRLSSPLREQAYLLNATLLI